MEYLSTRNNQLKESFRTILFQGLSKEGGLYLPINWPSINLDQLKNKSYEAIAHEIIFPFVSNDVSENQLKKILKETFLNFNHEEIAPLVNLNNNKFILELFYGPTYAFKDYALQFLGKLFSAMLINENKNITILGATSGDTGSAAINAFKGNQDIKLFILHPHKKVSDVQRRQMTVINDQNIHNIALEGTFDDCQKILKQLFVDNDLQEKTSLTAVNSINWARIIAQSVYYFWSYTKLNSKKINFIVPTGNFGNVFSARIASYMGLPIDQLNIVTNSNDMLHQTIENGIMKISAVKQTHSPSMDIQISSNFERQLFESSGRDSDFIQKSMLSFYNTGTNILPQHILKNLKEIYKTFSVSNSETIDTIKYFLKKYSYLADPHTATGLKVLNEIDSIYPTVSLACAHPAKFGDAIKKATGNLPDFPSGLDNIFDKEEKMTILKNDIEVVKKYILNNL